jgi:hypothetical protein
LWRGPKFTQHDVQTSGQDDQEALRRAIRGAIRIHRPYANKKSLRHSLRGSLATIGKHWNAEEFHENLSDNEQLSLEEVKALFPEAIDRFEWMIDFPGLSGLLMPSLHQGNGSGELNYKFVLDGAGNLHAASLIGNPNGDRWQWFAPGFDWRFVSGWNQRSNYI